MDADEEIAPAVESILAAAAKRETPGERLTVDARPLPDALAAAAADGRHPIIAEVKPTSPTTEGTREADPVDLARAMVEGGAAALSVLTEPEHFGGSPEALTRVREAVDVPVLRKDFLLDEAAMDVVRADLLLLIVRFVDDLPRLVAAARERGFEPLVEVHSRQELATAVDAGADVVGVNNRDLARLDVDVGTFERVAPAAPEDVTLIAESGLSSVDDVERMREAGADGCLVGSAIMDGVGEGGDPATVVRENTRRLTGQETTR